MTKPGVTIQRPLPNLKMKICLWNVRGACRKDFLPAAWSIIEEQHPHVFVLFETKSDDYRAKEVMFQLKFNDYRVIPPNDKRGGIWLFWKYEVDLVLFTAETSHFHVLFNFKNIQREVLVTGMHAPSVPGVRHQLWRNLRDNLPPPETPWLLAGDLNEVTSQSEKLGGRPYRANQSRDFTNFVDAAGLIDLGFSGCPFTWTNARDGIEMIKEMLDRALANPKLLDLFPQTKVHHLPRTNSDHAPIIISFFDSVVAGPFPFRCKEVWMEHPTFGEFFLNNWRIADNNFLRGRQNFLANIKNWNTNVFGNLNKQKRRLLARINGIQIALAKYHSDFLVNLEQSLLKDLNDIFRKERLIWAQKAGLNWRKYGDYNTKYFHLLAKIKKSRGKILALKNSNGDWITKLEDLKNLATGFYETVLLLPWLLVVSIQSL
ncbi:uncharacterized protein [Spinacia oleracea]|uniref:Endonuclease/exonuclease/phosphatase domain-containing protein n=1 Tax=Spinacia oleracea TaxID=3562 RepID=A0ABM3RP81_SPIOL|nr:uncharacterized protein LOC130471375 [Spinacia oleracea]